MKYGTFHFQCILPNQGSLRSQQSINRNKAHTSNFKLPPHAQK